MFLARAARGRNDRLLSRRFRPFLERLEERWVPSAIRTAVGFRSQILPRGDDNSLGPVSLGFTIELFGQSYESVFINNNGNLTFNRTLAAFNPSPLMQSTQPIIAPFFADVDTRSTASGEVAFGQDLLEGQRAFAVTWNEVGYWNAQSDRTNLFQVVLIERKDVAAGAFDIEFNYDRIAWDRGQASGISARVGYSAGIGKEGTFLELPGSAQDGAFLDGGPYSLRDHSLHSDTPGRYRLEIRPPAPPPPPPPPINHPPVWTSLPDLSLLEGQALQLTLSASDPDSDQVLTYYLVDGPAGATIDPRTGVLRWLPSSGSPPGAHRFLVGVSDSALPAASAETSFTVQIVNVAPQVSLAPPLRPMHETGRDFVLIGQFVDPGPEGAVGKVDFGDGSEPVLLPLQPDGSFLLRHTYQKQGNYTVQVWVTDASGETGVATTSIIVLGGGSLEKVGTWHVKTTAPGETTATEIVTPSGEAKMHLHYTRHEEATTPATLFMAHYTAPPLATTRQGTFFDIQLKGALPGDQVILTFSSELIKQGFEFGYFSPEDGTWVPLLQSPHLNEISIDRERGTMTVRFLVLDFFSGTVFTVSLPPGNGTTTTGTVSPPTAQGPPPSTGGSTPDTPSGLTRTVSFTSNTQLALALTASRDNSLAIRGTASGSQAGATGGNTVASGAQAGQGINSTAGLGGSEETTSSEEAGRFDEYRFWRWLQSEEGILSLLMQGIDPALILPELLPKPPVAPNPPAVPQPSTDPSEPASMLDSLDSAALAPETLQEIEVEGINLDAIALTTSQEPDVVLGAMALTPALLARDWSRRRRRRKSRLPLRKS